MLPTQKCIDHLANEIERAYSINPAAPCFANATRGVWEAAARRLWQVHIDHPELPVDASLFVASQRVATDTRNPWSQLAEPESGQRYHAQVIRIIRFLRVELKREVRYAERAMHRGIEIESILLTENHRLSPLGRYITAHRALRFDLAAHFADDALAQHRSCPLYQNASISLIPPDLYPTKDPHLAQIAEVPARDIKHRDISTNSAHFATSQWHSLNN